MAMPTDPDLTGRFDQLMVETRRHLESFLVEEGLPLDIVEFGGSGRVADGGKYEPLELLQIGMSEKMERRLSFLLILTDADLSSTRLSFTVAYASRLTNVGMISIRRLLPDFWGDEADDEQAGGRLHALMIHVFGHLLNLDHDDRTDNFMFDFTSVDDLDNMQVLDPEQRRELVEILPREAHDETRRGATVGFWLTHTRSNLDAIRATLLRANPIRLMSKLPTMLTTALSVVVVLFFSAEVWDVAGSVDPSQVTVFSVVALAVAVVVLYRTFGFRTILDRSRMVSESIVTTQTATALAVTATVVTVFAIFLGLTYLAAITIFPRPLMSAWSSLQPATEPVDHLKLSLFLGAMAVLTGSLGGRADSKPLVRTILFLNEES